MLLDWFLKRWAHLRIGPTTRQMTRYYKYLDQTRALCSRGEIANKSLSPKQALPDESKQRLSESNYVG
jgi:hypothetical protein